VMLSTREGELKYEKGELGWLFLFRWITSLLTNYLEKTKTMSTSTIDFTLGNLELYASYLSLEYKPEVSRGNFTPGKTDPIHNTVFYPIDKCYL
jgi:hypothetical protein